MGFDFIDRRIIFQAVRGQDAYTRARCPHYGFCFNLLKTDLGLLYAMMTRIYAASSNLLKIDLINGLLTSATIDILGSTRSHFVPN